ncbi:uncharacterized protein [Anabrus simplex]|uniref:uncharacterized protein n=1 Tax=Anabrus simplex TaxID=316456 RepID=UPI0034DCD9CF
MNNPSESQNWLGLFENFTSRTFNPCMGYLPCLRRQHQVHPDTSGLADSYFIHLSSERQIRVVHIESNVKHFTSLEANKRSFHSPQSVEYPLEAVSPQLDICSIKSRSHSIISNISEQSEDYWFTRWSRPLIRQTETCNCSFRKSWTKSVRDSKFSNHILPGTQEEEVHLDISHVDGVSAVETQNLTVIENFVEALIQEILHDTFRFLSESGKLGRFQSSLKYMQSKKNSSNIVTSPSSNSTSEVKDELTLNHSLFEEESRACEGDVDEIVHIKMGCVNPNFIGSLKEPDMLDGIKTESIHSNSIYCSKKGPSDHGASLGEIPSVLNSTHNQSPFGLSAIPKHSIESQSLSPTKGGTKESHTDIPVYDKRSENTFCLDPVTESNLQESINPEVNLRRKNNSCHHAASSTLRLKPVLFFLHGVGCSAELWANLVRHFAKEGYEVIAPDMLGHGYSSAPDRAAAYTFHHLLKDALDLFDKFIGENKICVIIGHAYGCSLAAAMARYRPQQVSQLVLISGGGPTPLAPRTGDCRPPSVSPCLQVLMKPLLLCGFRRDILYAPCGKHISYADALSSGIPPYVLQHIARGQDWPEGDSAFHRRILVPTLLVHGMKDPYVTLVQECEMERTIPRSFLELIPNAGHFAMLEAPKKLSHMIQCFIEWWSR